MERNLSVEQACELLGVTKQAWYEYHRQSFKDAVGEVLIVKCVRAIRIELPGIGGRKVKEVLYKEYGIDVGRDKLFDILERHGLLVRQRKHRTRTTFSGHGLPTYPDMRKEFVPTGINQLWVSDITYIWLGDRFHYLFLITDAYSKKIVGWEIADNMRHENAVTALKQCRKGDNPIHHSDKGLQYCAKKYVSMLQRRKMTISMTEGYEPRDNGIAERVNGILKEEFLKYMEVTADNIREVLTKIINAYHTRRPHLSLGKLTPEEVHRGAVPGAKLWKNRYNPVA